MANFHETWIRNTWPRPGMLQTSATGTGLLGRFLGHNESWHFEDDRGVTISDGHTDPLTELTAILSDLRTRFGHEEVGAIGYVGYEWGARQLVSQGGHAETGGWLLPDSQFLIFERLNHPQGSIRESRTHRGNAYSRANLDSLVQNGNLRRLVSKSRYLADVAAIQEHIAAGDVYQANYTQVFELQTERAPEENSRSIVERLQAPYSAFMRFGPSSIATSGGGSIHFPEIAIMTASPERFWRLRNGVIDSRPIKGTIGRAGSQSEDRELRRQLLSSRKDRAELLMITDLVRNDLGQVSEIGSVRTEALVRIRPTPSVWHLESTVTGRLDRSKTWVDVMKALHPAGSISGTPKKRAVQILSSLEAADRGPYCGAIGWVDANGDADFAVGIRTCVQIGTSIRIHSGGGVVADSDPESEYYESLIKIAPLLECLRTSPLNACDQFTPAMKEHDA